PPRKFKRPSSSLRPEDPRISLKWKPSPVRAPSSTPLKVPSFVKIPKRDEPPPKRDEPPRQDTKGWKPVQSFKPVEERIFYHSTNHVLALRESEYVLTNGYETASRKTEKHWQQALEQDLRYMPSRHEVCIVSTASAIIYWRGSWNSGRITILSRRGWQSKSRRRIPT
ncbi:hypothetical protein AVEN_20819-1, partial [Araneus ventricosus]